ncbi:MAG: acyl-CoA thioesterase [Marmoricola sp.]|jgi:acyl-CoA thioesterase-2|nr:acyl-CoA thioesterase [Marmoricola sp.]
MPSSVEELVELLDLEAIEDNLFRGRQPDTQMQRVFGGQVLAQSLVAAVRTVPGTFACHSLHSYFLRPGDTKVPIIYDVEEIRDGRSFCTRRVAARQHGRPIFFLTANFQVPEKGLEHQDKMPRVPSPEECGPVPDLESKYDDAWLREWAALDVRPVPSSRDAEEDADHAARSQWWIRASGELPDDPVVQLAAFTYASDMTLLSATLTPHDRNVETEGMQVASLDHSIWFHRPFRADQWWLYDQASPSASGGRGLAIARVFSQDGLLVASVAQEGLIRLRS